MTDREKLIELLGRLEYQYCESHSIMRENVVDYLIQHGVTVQRWIPASEPPKKHGAILAVFKYGRCKPFVEQMTYRGSFAQEVTHWMPLPEGPKEEKE